jgi:tripartite-type tricarboxylate transporter receptor subunit TctC
MPSDTLTRISSAIKQVVESDNFRKRAEEQGAKALFLGGTDLAKLASAERATCGRIVKVAGIKAD